MSEARIILLLGRCRRSLFVVGESHKKRGREGGVEIISFSVTKREKENERGYTRKKKRKEEKNEGRRDGLMGCK